MTPSLSAIIMHRKRQWTIVVVLMLSVSIHILTTNVFGYSSPSRRHLSSPSKQHPFCRRSRQRRRPSLIVSRTTPSIEQPTSSLDNTCSWTSSSSSWNGRTRSALLSVSDDNDISSIASNNNNSRTMSLPSMQSFIITNATTVAAATAESTKNVAAAPPTTETFTATAATSAAENGSGDGGGVLPSYRRLIVFTATTILIWLSEPLLSLVDTTIVGLTSATAQKAVVQIAALGPATTLYDSAIYMTYFLAIATTNQLAPKLARQDYRALRQSTSHLMGLALLFGTIVMAATFGLGRSVIAQMIGSSITDASIVPLATSYAMIRATVAPLCVVDFVAQSFCLTILDTKTPALAVAVASLVNVVGDLILSPIWGIQGAAIATAMATSTSCAILVTKVRRVMAQWKQKQEIQRAREEYFLNDDTSERTTMTTMDDDADTPSSKPGASDDIPFFSLPNKKAMIDLMKLAGPIFFVMMSKIACYSVLTVRATSFGVLPLATHNIMMRVFFFFACFGDSLSQAGQSFYPQVAKNVRGKLMKRLFYLSAAIGVSNRLFSELILKQFGRFLTKDQSIIHMMGQYSPFVGLAVFLHPFIMLFEGTVLAKRDLVFMVAMYVATGLLHFGHVFSPAAASFMGLWRALFVFQIIRLIQFAVRVWDTSRREKNAETRKPAAAIPAAASDVL